MANRKLQGEIDRVLKKVDEGVQVFEQIWDKVYSAATTAQKEKYEGDLKKEIKKLQRLRDQIKTWQGDSSIKDKTKLDANRKLIEEKMEKFKVCEKETKTKAFSKEGLAQDRTDPKQKAKASFGQWVQSRIATLKEQADEMEFDIESLNSGKRKKRGEENPRVTALKEQINRHEFHVGKLERVLRAVYNDDITPEEASDLKDNVDFYIESHHEPDFYEDDEMYDFLNLDQIKLPSTSSKKHKAERDRDRDRDEDNSSTSNLSHSSRDKKGPSSPRNSRGTRTSVTNNSIAKSHSSAATLRTSASPKNARERSPSSSSVHSPRATASSAPSRETNGHRHPSAPLLSSVVKSGPAATANFKGTANGLHMDNTGSRHTGTARPAAEASANSGVKPAVPSQTRESSEGPASKDTDPPNSMDPRRAAVPTQMDVQLSRMKAKVSNMDPQLAGLEQSLLYMPDSPSSTPKQNPSTRSLGSGTAAPLAATPRNPVVTPPSFPSVPAPVFDSRDVFAKFDPDTLFFIFYYQQGTHQQYLAASELKRQGWRFHKKYLTWFQRHDEPKVTTEDYETGTFIYFDYANVIVRGQGSGWCQRIKSEFIFEYRYLEDELK